MSDVVPLELQLARLRGARIDGSIGRYASESVPLPLTDLGFSFPVMSKFPTQQQLENAFIPAKEIDDATRFAGRVEQVEAVHLALLAEGANLAIVGNRGIGKSSLARQLIAMASGKAHLLDRLNVRYDSEHDFLTIYFACGDHTKSLNDLLSSLLTNDECLARWAYYVPQAKTELDSLSPKLNVGIAALESGSSMSRHGTAAVKEHDLQTIFTNVVNAITKQGLVRDGILLVVDEFDQINDPSGFASFLKSLATNAPKVRFCVVGVAHDLRELMKEHASADRLFASGIVHLPPMSDKELVEIISLSERYVDDAVLFHVEAKSHLAELAQGHPYMVHLIGKYALRAAFASGKTVIEKQDIENTLRVMAEKQTDPHLEGRYKAAVKSSPQRESVLRAMASATRNGEVWTSDAYKIAIDDGVENASQYVGNLVSDQFGSELVKVSERYYRFRDSLFRAYVMARPRQFLVEES